MLNSLYYSVMKFRNALLIVVLLVLSAFGVAAQTKKLSEKEFNRLVVDTALSATAKKVRHISRTVYRPGTETKSYVAYEIIPPDRFRSYGGLLGSQKRTWEYIEFENDDFFYIKDEDGVWKTRGRGHDFLPPYPIWRVFTTDSGRKIKISEVRKDLLNGLIVQKYSRWARTIFTASKGEPIPAPVDSLQEIWIGSDGLFLCADQINYDGNTGEILDKEVMVWDYDPSIKIEAPIK